MTGTPGESPAQTFWNMRTVLSAIGTVEQRISVFRAILYAIIGGICCGDASPIYEQAAGCLPHQPQSKNPLIAEAFPVAPVHIAWVMLPRPTFGIKPFCQIVHMPGQGTSPKWLRMVLRSSPMDMPYSLEMHFSQTMWR